MGAAVLAAGRRPAADRLRRASPGACPWRGARPRSFARGEVLVHEGDPADSLHLIESGRVAVRIATPTGERATLNILSPGDYFGELSLVRRWGDRHRTATVVALEPTATLVVSVAAFDELCRK